MRRDVITELKELRLFGMVSAWTDLLAQGSSDVSSCTWLIEHLLQAEHTDRAMRSVSHQLKAARFPLHRDLAKFDFKASSVDEDLVKTLATMAFTNTAQNVVFIGGPGTGKTHLATAIAVSGITAKDMRVRFYSTVDLVNQLEQEKAQGKAGRIATSLMRLDLVILDELGYLPFSQAGGALLFHLLSKLYEHTSVAITTNLSFSAMVQRVCGCEDDHRVAGPAHPPLPHCGDGQRVVSIPAQFLGGQVTHQGARTIS